MLRLLSRSFVGSSLRNSLCLLSASFVIFGTLPAFAKRVSVRFVLQQYNKDKGDVVAILVTSEDEFYAAMNEPFKLKEFYKKKVSAKRPEKVVIFDLDSGVSDFAIIAFQDMQGNGKLDKGSFGPMEPIGFTNGYDPSYSMPKYSDIAISADSVSGEIVIKVG